MTYEDYIDEHSREYDPPTRAANHDDDREDPLPEPEADEYEFVGDIVEMHLGILAIREARQSEQVRP